MASPRKNAPALYELIGVSRRPGEPDAAVPEREEVHREDHHHEPATHIGPGRTVRMPVGFFFIGVAAVIAAAVGGYTLGYMKKGQEISAEERRQAAAEAALLREPSGFGGVNPDLLGGAEDRSADRQRATQPRTQTPPRTRPETAPTQQEARIEGPAGLIIVGGGTPDPRESGKNYAILSSVGWDRALALGEFLASQGLEVAVLPAHNGRLHPVVSLGGLTREEYRSSSREQHERLLKRLGREWAASGTGRKDFEGLYWARYD